MEENQQIIILDDGTILTQVPAPYSDYYCDIENGIVYSARTGESLKRLKGYERPLPHNYVTTSVTSDDNGEARCMGIHELIMAARECSWEWKTLHGLEINHINERKNDNRGYVNLELKSHKEQYTDSVLQKMSEIIKERTKRGSNHPRAKLDENDVLEIRQRYGEWDGTKWEFIRMITDEFEGISDSSINALLCGRTWTHV